MATNPYEAVLKQLEEKNKQDVATAQAQAGTQAQQSYIDYMNSIKNLNQGLASQGITGGGSESALLGANVGYQRQKNLVASNLASNLQGLSQNYMANRTAVQTQSAEWEAAKQAQDEQRFANTITGYDTVGKVDNAIEAAQTAGETWKVPYLMAQRAALLEQAKAEAAAVAKAVSGGSGNDSGLIDTEFGLLPKNSTFSETQLAGYGAYRPPAGNYSSSKKTTTNYPSNAYIGMNVR